MSKACSMPMRPAVNASATGGNEVQEPKALGDMRGCLPGFRRDLLDRVPGPFVFKQGPKPLRFLKRMHVGPLDVFDELCFERFLVVRGNDANRNLQQPCSLRGAIAPRSRDDFEMPIHFPCEKRREDALAADALG